MSDYFADMRRRCAAGPDIVSWLPFYHDMGLVLGVCAPILAGSRAVLTSPVSFLQRPARWMQLLATNPHAFSAAPNFAFELAARKTSDEDMAGLDLGGVHSHPQRRRAGAPATLKRFTERFARFNLTDTVIRPSYGLAEATVYVATRRPGQPPEVVYFDSEKLSAGQAKRCESGDGTPLVSYARAAIADCADRRPRYQYRVSGRERSARSGCTATTSPSGYWQNLEETERTFGATIVDPSAGTPEGPWLRTGDLGFISDGELFIMGRIKDLLDRLWAQPLSRRHRGDDPGDHRRPVRGDRRSGRRRGEAGRHHRSQEAGRLRRGCGAEDSAPSSVKSPRRYRTRTASAWRIWFWWRLVRFRSPPAARSGERRVSSSTGRSVRPTGRLGKLVAC